MRSRAYASIARGASALAVLGLLSCEGGTVATQPTPDVPGLYWALTLDHGAVTLAVQPPFDTLTLTATPSNPTGAALEGLGPVTFTSTDLARLRVSPEGVLQAVAPGRRIQVVAKLQALNVTHLDTVFVDVTAAPPAHRPTGISIHPVPPDSAKLDNVSTKQIVPRVTDVDGNAVSGLLIDFVSLDPTLATINRATGILAPQGRLGQARIVASATVYGVRLADTVTYTMGLPATAVIEVHAGADHGASTATVFAPGGIRVGVGATVVWIWTPDLTATDVTFEDPTFVAEDPVGIFGLGAFTGAGDIPQPEGCTFADPSSVFLKCIKARRFSVPGVYRFRSTLTGATGQVVVEAEG